MIILAKILFHVLVGISAYFLTGFIVKFLKSLFKKPKFKIGDLVETKKSLETWSGDNLKCYGVVVEVTKELNKPTYLYSNGFECKIKWLATDNQFVEYGWPRDFAEKIYFHELLLEKVKQ